MRRVILFLTVIWLFEGGLNAQYMPYEFKSLSLEAGLSQSSVMTIFQDSKGFVWFGTYDGLNRFDGREMTVFSPAVDNDRSISEGAVFQIDEGADGRLYIAMDGGGLNIYDPATELFEHFRYSGEHSLISDFLFEVLCVNDTSVWLASTHGVCKFNPLNNTFRNYVASQEPGAKFPYVSAMSLYALNGQLWAGTAGKGLVKYDGPTDRFISYINPVLEHKHQLANYIHDIEYFNNDELMLATVDGLFLFNVKTEVFRPFLIEGIELLSIVEDSDGAYWIASAEGGLYRINEDEKVENYRSNPYDNKSLPEDFLLTVYADEMKNIWVGTKSKGAVKINLEKKPFDHYYHVPNRPGISGNSVFGLAEGENNEVWVGTLNGLTCWYRDENRYEQVPVTLFGKQHYQVVVWALYRDNSDLWIGTSSGLVRHDLRTKKQVHYYHDPDQPLSLVANEVFGIMRDDRGFLWIATNDGVSRLNDKDNTFINYRAYESQDGISHPTVWNVRCDKQGQLWFCTANGLNRYSYEKDNFELFQSVIGQPSALVSNDVSNILETQGGNLWFATRNGISIYYKGQGKVINLGLKEGMPNTYIYSLLEADNSVWASTNKGLAVIDKQSLKIDHFDVKDGIQSNEFNVAALKLKDGYFLFGGINGLTGFYPDQIQRSGFEPPLYFTGMSLFGEKISPRDSSEWEDVVLKKSIINASRIKLTYEEKLFSLEFSALDYSNPQRINYYYRMLPNSTNWLPLGNQNFVTFLNLNPGSYELQVKSTNADGLMCDNMKAISIVVQPPFWRKGWVIALEVVVVVLLVLLVFRIRMNRLRRDKLKLEKLVEERTREIESQRNIAHHQRDEIGRQKARLEEFAAELEQKVKDRTSELEFAKIKAEESDRLKSAFLSNMSHEIRTPMNAIIGFSELLLDSSFSEEERSAFARMIKSNGDTLLNLLNDIIDISMIESGQLKLHLEDTEVNALMQDVFLSFKQSKTYQEKQSVEFRLSGVSDTMQIIHTDPNRLRQVLNNLVSNALKFTEGGHVEMGYRLDEKKLLFFVKDTGSGISEEDQIRIFDRFLKLEESEKNLVRGSGLGLAITKNLVEILKGKMWLESKKGLGSSFYFTLPV